MLTAITRAVSPAIEDCELTFVARAPINLAKAVEQHRAYERLLENFGVRVFSLPAEPGLADSMFVEDPALVLDELAVIFPLGTESRRAEAESLAKALSPDRELTYVRLPGTMEGGDILRIGRRIFAGLSKRTNAEGIRQLQAVVGPHGYEVTAVSDGQEAIELALSLDDSAEVTVVHAWDRPSYVGEQQIAHPDGSRRSLSELIRENAEREMTEFLARVASGGSE